MDYMQTDSSKNMTEEDLLSFSYFEKYCAKPLEYGYGGAINEIRKKEFSRIGDSIYLDHVGTALFPQSLLERFMKDLSENVYGNPHSQNIISRLTHDTVEHVRYRILQHFNTDADDYTVIFTSGSTAALKCAAETFPWTSKGSDNKGSHFCYFTDNHTSVVGMRRITSMMNVSNDPIRPEEIVLSEYEAPDSEYECTNPCHLFCYPALSNFSGIKYPLSWIEGIKSGRIHPNKISGNWFVLLDAASYVSTSPLDLSIYQPDFIALSFYKIFGFPTGLGALLVSKRVAPLLRKNYFGGGTAAAYLSGEDFYVPKPSIADRFEDGTISFLDIIALKHGFDVLEGLTGGMENIKSHTHTLASYTYSVLSALRYANGQHVVQIYSDTEVRNSDVQGPVITFNVLDENGDIIGYSQVDKMASLYNIHLRTGCFCNTGACQKHLGLSNSDVKNNLQSGHICGDDMDIIDGCPTGAIRISFGFMSTFEDARTFLKFIIESFVKRTSQSNTQMIDEQSLASSIAMWKDEDKEQKTYTPNGKTQTNIFPDGDLFPSSTSSGKKCACESNKTASIAVNDQEITLSHIYLYPIKSCAAFQVSQWPIAEQGLLFDRSWMIVNNNGVCISQKQEPKLCLIHPSIDLKKGIMLIEAKGMTAIQIPLNDESRIVTRTCQNKVCGDRVLTYDCGEEAADWLYGFLNRKCRLIRQSTNFNRYADAKRNGISGPLQSSLSLVNEAQYLLVNTASIFHLSQQMALREECENKNDLHIETLIQRFRANLVINGKIQFEEEEWTDIFIDNFHFQTSGKCTRCQIICIDQKTGEKKKEVFQRLSSCREGKTTFGMYLLNSPCSTYPSLLKVGSPLLYTAKKAPETMIKNHTKEVSEDK
ncbi:molybdenum cofactor sulfurase [Bombina bombina]|uniref:molybdenum cofactor sulfurase n=1 Tax=Bombina bombina TaxID=8345 RepID=UPI00235A855B|nr:molybdenum cofactor sulfurase [Bombina bombina]